jgi:uncharacterized protein
MPFEKNEGPFSFNDLTRTMIRTAIGVLSALAIFAIIVFVFAACGEGNNDTGGEPFDREPMLINFADNLIIPVFSDLKTKTTLLHTAATTFSNDPSANNLSIVQQTWTDAFLSWQYANSYNFGPAGEEGVKKALVQEIGTWPVSESKIDQAISSGTYDLEDFNRDARGFLAVEYLVFSLTDDNTAIMESFNSANRKKYLTDLTANIKTAVDVVHNAWTTSYRSQFVASTGTSVGSSTSMLYNEFIKSYEAIKNYKVGIPSGQRPGQVTTEPAKVEAYYSGKTIQMLKANFISVEDIWYGRAESGSDGIGFREYLERVEGGTALIASTETQLMATHAALDPLSDSPRLSEQLVSDPVPFANLHNELQKGLRFFKSDMSSILGISITYSSGDGD